MSGPESAASEASYFFAAVRFFTRLPVPDWVGHSQAQLDRAARYFPLVGALVGLMGAVATVIAACVLPLDIAILLGMAVTLLGTGGFHEDGFTDACDGFGGGWTREQILTIMKDSRIGSFGTIGIVVLLAVKWQALLAIGTPLLAVALVAGHAASRLASTAVIYALEYVREDELSRAKPLARRMSIGDLAVATLWGLLPCLLLPAPCVRAGLLAAAVTTVYAARAMRRRLGGYTGDCLGAVQQLSEVAFYLGVAALR